MMLRKSSMRASFVLLGAVIVLGASEYQEIPTGSLAGLDSIFTTGPVFQDRNGDDVVDYVQATIILGDSPSTSDVAAAADIAARLGFETMAMDLPMSTDLNTEGLGILVGSAAVQRAGLDPSAAGMEGLEAGEGVVRFVSSGEKDWVVVAGADDSGTRSAAMALAGKLPHIGAPKGKKLEDVTKELETFLSDQGVETEEIHVESVHVKSGEDAFERLVVVVELETAAAQRTARRALRTAARRAGSGESEDEPPLSYEGAKVLRVVLSAPGASPTGVNVPRVEPEDDGGPIPARPGSGAKEKLDLSSIYSNDGFLGDSDRNVIPDRIDVLLCPSGDGVEATMDLAARLSLESTGVVLPIAEPAETLEDPKKAPTLVLIGVEHPIVKQLVEDEKVSLPTLEPGQGYIQVVPKAFGKKSAVVITGGDAQGLDRAIQQVAEHFPHVWERGKDRTTIDDIELDIWRFFSGRSPAGQATIAMYKLDQLIADLSGKDLESAHVLVSLEKTAEGLEGLVRQKASALGAGTLDVTIDNRDVEKAKVLLEEDIPISSEVDDFWQVFRTRILPKAKKKRQTVIEVRLSEPPEIRAKIEQEIRVQLTKKGVREEDLDLRVLSAYKQGFSWLYDSVRPRLQGQSIGKITIRFSECGPPEEWPQQAMTTPIRWLKEIFPIDEVLAKELGVDLEKIQFEKTPIGSTTYEVIAMDTSGQEILRETFEPKYVLRPYADRFQDYEKVRVTTGWVYAKVRDDVLADQRIITDAERFWDIYQEKTLPAAYDHIMKLHEGNPRGNGQDAPYFGKLMVELSLSEPDYLIGVDKELISPMDALHEEIYFGSLLFFRLLGRNARGEELTYVGRVIPVMKPKNDGKAGQAKITFTGFATSRPAVVIEYKERNGRVGKARRDVPKVTMERPEALAAWVRDGSDGIERLHVRVKVDTENDERKDLIKRARAEQVDALMLSATQVKAALSNLQELRLAGMYPEALSYHDLGVLQIAAGWEHDVNPETQAVAELEPNGRPEPLPDIRKLLPAGYSYKSENLVQWETPMPPREAHEVLAKMATFPEMTAYKIGESYLGQEIWAADLMPPVQASHWSHAKATTLKPTIVNSGRQHANEVSSTSHILKWAEMLLTDPEYKEHLKKVNVVIHPVTNADGAQLAYDLYKITPELILHAGYLGPLGMDATSDGNQPMPIYPEATIRPRLWNTWLPDIFLNPHGYPSHQVVQLFSEFDGLVRRGRVTERNWSMNKGWFIPGFGYLDDPQFPEHKKAAFKIRDYITKGINSDPDVVAMNQRNYARHERYGVQFDDETYKVDMTDDVLIYMPLKGAKAEPSPGSRRRGYNPRVTIWSGGTEAPDETAHGEWMRIMATAGLEWNKAALQYLVDGDHKVDRKGTVFWGGVHLSMNRPRPPQPEKEKEEEESSTQ